MAQPKSRVPLFVGLTVAGGVGYYLYSAGGSPKAAEKQFEADVNKASAKIKSEMPGRSTGTKDTAYAAKDQAESYAHQASSKIDQATSQARAELEKTEAKLEAYRKDVSKEAMKKVDQFDAKVEEGAAKAKSGISSWFGGK